MEQTNNTKIEGFGGVKFWIERVAQEYLKLSKKDLDKVSLLFYQLNNFDKMRDEVKGEVIRELIKDIENVFGKEADRIKEEYFKLNKEGKELVSIPPNNKVIGYP